MQRYASAHVDELALLWHRRLTLVGSAPVSLEALTRHDERMAAHQDGCIVSLESAREILEERLDGAEPPQVFVAVLVALEMEARDTLRRYLLDRGAAPDSFRAVASAFGWTSKGRLMGVVKSLLSDPSSVFQRLGVAACRVHGVDPGLARIDSRLGGTEARAELLRTAGVLGELGFLPRSVEVATHADSDARFWASWSAVLLGNRGVALDALTSAGLTPGPDRVRAFRLALQAISVSTAHGVLQSLARDPDDLRWLIQGSGIAGDPTYIPWLIAHMEKPETARLAGEAFTLITGADFDKLQLYGPRPDDFEGGPTDNPEDENVEMDPDEGLMWPDIGKVQQWWGKNANRFQKGTRYFMGARVTREHCIDVLKNGYQRQRILAAHYLCLLDPGTPLFNTSAPAWRQQKLLAELR